MAHLIPKGCTAKNTFTFPYDGDSVSTLYITYQQNGSTVLEFTKDSCTISDKKIVVNLTQEDTLKFTSNSTVSIQIRAKFTSGDVVKSNIVNASVDKILKSGEI